MMVSLELAPYLGMASNLACSVFVNVGSPSHLYINGIPTSGLRTILKFTAMLDRSSSIKACFSPAVGSSSPIMTRCAGSARMPATRLSQA